MVNTANYITTNRFYVEIDGGIQASFTECSGWGVKIQKEVYQQGGANTQQLVLIGHAEYDDVTLKHGMTDDTNFCDWIAKALKNPPSSARCDVYILLFNQAGQTQKCVTLKNAFPIGWRSDGFQADGSSVAIEELTLAYDYLVITK